MKHTSLPLFVITLFAAVWIVGCNRQSDEQISLETPKGYAPAAAVAQKSWEEAVKDAPATLVEAPAPAVVAAVNPLAQYAGPFVVSPSYALQKKAVAKASLPIRRMLSNHPHLIKARHHRHHR